MDCNHNILFNYTLLNKKGMYFFNYSSRKRKSKESSGVLSLLRTQTQQYTVQLVEIEIMQIMIFTITSKASCNI